jgi:hypothetical protein
VRAIRGALHRLPLYWEAGLRRLPFFTQRTAVLLLGVLAGGQGSRGTASGTQGSGSTASGAQGSGGTASGAQGSGGAAGAGAGGPPAAPPTTSPPTTAPQGPLDPVDELLGPVVSTLLP